MVAMQKSPSSPRSPKLHRPANGAIAKQIRRAHRESEHLCDQNDLIAWRLVHQFWNCEDELKLTSEQRNIVRKYYEKMKSEIEEDRGSLKVRSERGLRRLDLAEKREKRKKLAEKCEACAKELKRVWLSVNNAQISKENRPFVVKRKGMEPWEPFAQKRKISLQVLQLMVHLLHPSENFKEVMDFEGSLPDAKVESTGKVCSYRWAMNVQPDETTKYSPDETDFRTPEVCALALVVAMHNHDLVSIEEFIWRK